MKNSSNLNSTTDNHVGTHETSYETIRYLVNLMDEQYRIPGTRYRFGLDPIIGLVPVVGDFLPSLLSLYLIWLGYRENVSWQPLAKMGFNTLLDFSLGMVPVAGDLADVALKCHSKNLAILKEELSDDTDSN